MRTKSILLLVVALGCGVVASVAVSQVLTDQGANEPQTVGILISTKDIPAMTKLSPESFRIEQWPADKVPPGAITNPAQVEGKFTKQKLFASEAILEAKISEKGRDLQVPSGYRAFDMKVDESNGGSGYIGPGDHVDINGFFEKGKPFPVSKSMTVMKNVEVMSVDGVATRDPEAPPKRASTIQLLVKASQYEALHTASRLGSLTPTLRGSDADDIGPDDGKNFMDLLREADSAVTEKPAGSEIPMASYTPPPPPPQRHEMVVMTPKGRVVYVFKDDNSLPEKVDPTNETNQTTPYNNFAPYPMSPPLAFPPANRSANPGTRSSKSTSSSKRDSSASTASDLDGLSQVFDPTSGTWQSGGFKATNGGGK